MNLKLLLLYVDHIHLTCSFGMCLPSMLYLAIEVVNFLTFQPMRVCISLPWPLSSMGPLLLVLCVRVWLSVCSCRASKNPPRFPVAPPSVQ